SPSSPSRPSPLPPSPCSPPRKTFPLRGGRGSGMAPIPFPGPREPAGRSGRSGGRKIFDFCPATVMNILEKLHRERMKDKVPDVNVGDTVKVHTRVVEGGKERIQVFAGIII